VKIIKGGKEVPVSFRSVAACDVPCPSCGKPPKSVKAGETTLVGYTPHFDAEGRLHEHDENCVVADATCENGHRYAATGHFACPCGWRSHREDCFCNIAHMKPRLLGEGADAWCP